MGQADERDGGLRTMVQLVQRTFADGGRSDESGLHRLQARMARKRRRRQAVVGLSLLLAGAAPVALVFALRPAPLTFEVIHGSVGATGEVRPTEPGTQIRFSDGTAIVLEEAARAQVRDVAAHGAGIVLVDGRAHTLFVPKPKARWQVLAGPYVVRVTGTVFDVAWSRDREQLDVWLKKGSVVVSGPLVEGGVAVGRDQHLSLRPTDHRIVLENGADAPPDAPAAGAPSPAAGGAAVQGLAPDTESLLDRVGALEQRDRRADRPPPDKSWGRRLAEGDFEAVIAGAERRGITGVLAHGSAKDVAALADAARYTRRAELARRALLVERSRFAGSAEAREASYFLGVLAEDQGAWREALSWYARYRRDDPAGTYAAPALGRTLVLEARQQDEGAARADAAEYLRRYPGGPYAPAARQIAHTDAPSSSAAAP
ncbi:MAG TPA: FecR domain-containing protein [Polyangia bacterium]|nr:FecR domain-containing protein [Polyangia bacterium]